MTLYSHGIIVSHYLIQGTDMQVAIFQFSDSPPIDKDNSQ